MRFIGISGFARSGKDASRDIIFEYLAMHKMKYVGLSFADPVKRIASQRYGHHCVDFYSKSDSDNAEYLKRRILQQIGSEEGRGFCEDIWIEFLKGAALDRAIEMGIKDISNFNVVTADVRFPNEAHWVLSSKKNILFLIDADKRQNTQLSNGIYLHMSESYITSIREEHRDRHHNCIYVENNGTLDDLRRSIFSKMDEVLIGLDPNQQKLINV